MGDQGAKTLKPKSSKGAKPSRGRWHVAVCLHSGVACADGSLHAKYVSGFFGCLGGCPGPSLHPQVRLAQPHDRPISSGPHKPQPPFHIFLFIMLLRPFSLADMAVKWRALVCLFAVLMVPAVTGVLLPSTNAAVSTGADGTQPGTSNIRSNNEGANGGTRRSTGAQNTVPGILLWTLKGHTDAVWSAAWSPDGRTIVSAGDDGTLRLWGAEGTLLKTLQAASDSVRSASWSPDGRLIASTGDDGTMQLWDSRGKPLKTMGHDFVLNTAWSPDGHFIASGVADGALQLWGANGTLLKILDDHCGRPLSAAWSPDGRTIVSAADDGTLRLWGVNGTLSKTLDGHSVSAAWSPDGRMILSRENGGTLRLWESSGTLLQTLDGHSDWVRSVAWSPDSRTVVCAGDDGTMQLWGTDGTLLKTWVGHSGLIMSAAWSPDGRRIVSAGADGMIRLWDSTGTLLTALEGHSRVVLSVAWSPDGCLLVSTGDDGTVRVWRANSAQHVSGPGNTVIRYTSEVIVGRGGEHVPFAPIVALVLACVVIGGSLALGVIGAMVRRTLARPLGQRVARLEKVVCSPWFAPARAAGQTAVDLYQVQAAPSDPAPTEVLGAEQSLRAH